MTITPYRSFLRISIVVVAFLVVLESGLLFPITRHMSLDVYEYLGSVGSSVRATVPENELNILTAQISARERELDERERLLAEREIAARNFGADEPSYTLYSMSVILFVLSTLMIMNFYLDWKRTRRFVYDTQMD